MTCTLPALRSWLGNCPRELLRSTAIARVTDRAPLLIDRHVRTILILALYGAHAPLRGRIGETNLENARRTFDNLALPLPIVLTLSSNSLNANKHSISRIYSVSPVCSEFIFSLLPISLSSSLAIGFIDPSPISCFPALWDLRSIPESSWKLYTLINRFTSKSAGRKGSFRSFPTLCSRIQSFLLASDKPRWTLLRSLTEYPRRKPCFALNLTFSICDRRRLRNSRVFLSAPSFSTFYLLPADSP